MFGAILNATNSSFQKGMTFCLSIYIKKVMELLAFIFEHPLYWLDVKGEKSNVPPDNHDYPMHGLIFRYLI